MELEVGSQGRPGLERHRSGCHYSAVIVAAGQHQSVGHPASQQVGDHLASGGLASGDARERPGPCALLERRPDCSPSVLDDDEVGQCQEEDESERGGQDELNRADPAIAYPPMS